MPELPEVQTVVDTLRPSLVRSPMRRVDVLRADVIRPCGFDLEQHLAGRCVVEITRRGKRIVLAMDDGNRWYIHLGMTGRLTIEKVDAPVLKHTHLMIILDGRKAGALSLRFRDPRRFGGIWWLGNGIADDKMGPEPLLIRTPQLARRLSRTGRAIKNVLLDQTVLAGVGNIYADESLFEAGIHPLTPADTLDSKQVSRLNRAVKSTLRRALRHRGSTLRDYVDADGAKGGFQKLHRVYDRAGKPCRICKTAIERLVLGGRSSHFCPRCQKFG